MICAVNVFSSQELDGDGLVQQTKMMAEWRLHAGKLAAIAENAMLSEKEEDIAEQNVLLRHTFEECNKPDNRSPIILHEFATKEKASRAASYYWEAAKTLYLIGSAATYELLALKTSTIDPDTRGKLIDAHNAMFECLEVKSAVSLSELADSSLQKDTYRTIPSKLQEITTPENALIARTYYKGVRESLLGCA